MIKIEKLATDNNARMVEILELIRHCDDIRITTFQRILRMGYMQSANYLAVLEEAGVIRNPQEYCMVMWEDGEWHREHLPCELVASEEEIQQCINALKAAE